MVKRFSFSILLMTMLLVSVSGLFISCSKQSGEDVFSVSEKTEVSGQKEDYQIEALLLSVDSLNAVYGFDKSELRGFGDWLRARLTESVADAIGGAVGAWAGKHAGASIGAAVANPVVAVGGYVVGRKVGGLVGATAASYAASLILGTTTSASLQERGVPIVCDTTVYEVNSTSTYGDIHNALLDRLRGQEVKYLHADGSVKIEDIYNDLLMIEREMGIIDPLSSDPHFKAQMIQYCASTEKVCESIASGVLPKHMYSAALASDAAKVYAIPQAVMNTSMALIDKVSSAVAKLDESEVKQYERDFLKVVDRSSLKVSDKEYSKAVGSIAIGSTVYWMNEKER